jgi:hypothetical protein
MRLSDIRSERRGTAWTSSALVEWEDADRPEFRLVFEIGDTEDRSAGAVDAFAAACFPLAAVHRERRLRLEGALCPLLGEGLRTVHAWWRRWGGMPADEPLIEAASGGRPIRCGPKTALSLLSGGVDSLHTLYHNRQIYRRTDPAYIRTALFVHGYDIGKRARDAEGERYRMALDNLVPLAEMMGVRLLACRTNLRHLPAPLNFWTFRHVGAALAAMGHAAAQPPLSRSSPAPTKYPNSVRSVHILRPIGGIRVRMSRLCPMAAPSAENRHRTLTAAVAPRATGDS